MDFTIIYNIGGMCTYYFFNNASALSSNTYKVYFIFLCKCYYDVLGLNAIIDYKVY